MEVKSKTIFSINEVCKKLCCSQSYILKLRYVLKDYGYLVLKDNDYYITKNGLYYLKERIEKKINNYFYFSDEKSDKQIKAENISYINNSKIFDAYKEYEEQKYFD